jgi:hypothetical protein
MDRQSATMVQGTDIAELEKPHKASSEEVKMTNASQRFYVLSTGRAGSTFLSNCLDSTGEFDHQLHQQDFSRKLNIDSNKVIDKPSGQAALVKDYLGKFSEGIPSSSCDPLQSMALYYLLENRDQDAKVIHLVRDPRAVVRSFMNWKNRKVSGKVAHHLVPYWMPIPTQTDDMSLMQYAMLPKYVHYAWIWNFKNRLFGSLKIKDNYRLIRLEDLYASEEVMNELFGFIGVKTQVRPEKHGQKSNASEMREFPMWRDWTPKMAKNIDRYCGPLMNELGYGTEPEWKALLAAK